MQGLPASGGTGKPAGVLSRSPLTVAAHGNTGYTERTWCLPARPRIALTAAGLSADTILLVPAAVPSLRNSARRIRSARR